ncbi:hypothetical protein J5N97_023861 [Dioscorea zingiberensis]|uniref:Uncharacterized protein n=1 Tax=Dioscorea zingiberensis TaxID=325984 RepID=A0A9D5C6E3_9LILI|nr:hypothetical protein J5N97_023861 [Dioscorea zingiberensis]
MLRSQQSQIETLADDRRHLETYVRAQHESWASRFSLLESQMAQMKGEEAKRRLVESAWLDLAVGMKQREALCYKKLFELTESDVEDFRECVAVLSGHVSELKLKGKEVEDRGIEGGNEKNVENTQEEEPSKLTLELEIKKLKQAYKKLSSKKEAEITALLAEKDFVWNQLKKMENDYIGILKTKKIEVHQANEAVEKLQSMIENLQMSNSEKDEAIARFVAERTRLELDVRRCNEEAQQAKEKAEELQLKLNKLHATAKEKDKKIDNLRKDVTKLEMDVKQCTFEKTRLSKDLESQRSSRNASVTPVGSHIRISSGKRKRGSANSRAGQMKRDVYDNSGSRAATAPSRLRRCSNRSEKRIISTPEIPALFSSNFKIPKLKISSPAVVS